jgi:hypothetical protein
MQAIWGLFPDMSITFYSVVRLELTCALVYPVLINGPGIVAIANSAIDGLYRSITADEHLGSMVLA